MNYLTVDEVLSLHDDAIARFGGSPGVRDAGLLDSAVAQPQAGFGGVELYPTLAEKAAAIGYALVKNHAFIDGNKRVGLAALDVFLRLNGYRIPSDPDGVEATILAVADGSLSRAGLAAWVAANVVPHPNP